MLVSSLLQTSPERVTVCMEDGSEIKSTLGVVTDMRLFAGKNLDDSAIDQLKISSMKYLALEKAANLLSYRMMSKKELYDKLLGKGFDEDTALFCADKLEDNGLINDELYSDAVVRHYFNKSYGKSRIKAELIRRGINREIIDQALEKIPDTDDNIDKILHAKLSDPTDQKQIKKVTDALFRRGYSWDEIKSALRRFEDE